jgi:site-specific DNA recombinase
MNRRRMEARASIDAARSELGRIERELERIMDLYLKDAMPIDLVKEKSRKLDARRGTLQSVLASAEEPPPVLHPSMAVIYRARVTGLYEALQQEGVRAAASDVIRSLVSEIVLTPAAGELLVDLRGDLAGILAIASSDKQKPSFLSDAGPELLSQVMLVAGTGFEPVTFRL